MQVLKDEIRQQIEEAATAEFARKGFAGEFVRVIEEHFVAELPNSPGRRMEEDAFVLHIIAANRVEGLLDILRHSKNERWAGRKNRAAGRR
jgi:hypothetical protein